jgi:phosphatidate cytidylyltransferase
VDSRFAKRLLFGSLLVGMLAFGLWVDMRRADAHEPPIAASVMIAAFTLPALAELARILTAAGLPTPAPPLVTVGFALLAGKTVLRFRASDHAGAWVVVLATASVLFLALLQLRERDLASGAARAAGPLLGVALALLLSSMVDVAYDWGTRVLFALVLTAKAGDSGAYLVGKTLGRTRLIEHVSPKKTVEGALGGLAASIGVGIWLFGTFGGGRWSTAAIVLVAAAVNVAGQIGDLYESLWKRAAGVKDSGRLLPEFGGALDIVDSLFLAMPVGWGLLTVLSG